MTIVKYLLQCLFAFFDGLVGNGADASWLNILVGALIICVALGMYFIIYWRVISPRCYKMWLCTVLTFISCVLIWALFILFCIGGEAIIRAIF